MHYTPELGSREADVQAAREAEHVTTETRFINYGREGDTPVDAGTLSDITKRWAARGVIGTSEVPHYKRYAQSATSANHVLAMTVSEALEMVKARADEAAGQLAVGNAVEHVGRWAEDTQIDTVEVKHPGLAAIDEAA